jgi:hypothetical protein
MWKRPEGSNRPPERSGTLTMLHVNVMCRLSTWTTWRTTKWRSAGTRTWPSATTPTSQAPTSPPPLTKLDHLTAYVAGLKTKVKKYCPKIPKVEKVCQQTNSAFFNIEALSSDFSLFVLTFWIFFHIKNIPNF